MPRTRRTNRGAPGQPVAPVPGQTYGMGVEQQRLAEAMPAPAIQPAGPPAGVPGMQGGVDTGVAAGQVAAPTGSAVVPAGHNGGEAGAVDATARYQATLAAAQQMAGRAGILTSPTRRPQEPVTAGLPVGPGPGPEVLGVQRGNPTGIMLRQLAAATGDVYLRELADRARL